MTPIALNKSFLLSKILGCFPFCLNDGRTKVDFRLLVFSLFVKLVFAPQPILNIFQASFIMSRTKVHLMTATVSFILAVIFSSVSFACYFWNRRKLDLVIRNYTVADEQFKKLGQTPYSKVNLWFDYLMIVLIIGLPCIRVYVTPRLTCYMAYQLVYLVHVMSSLFMLIQPFVRIVGNLTARMKKVRTILQHVSKAVSGNDKNRKLESVIQLYDLLCSTCDVLNDIYSQNLLFVTFMVFFMITTYVYYSMTNVFGSYVVAIIQGFVAAYYSIIISLISIYCDRMSEESRVFNVILFHMMIEDKTDKLVRNRKLRLHISMKREVVFTACGLFPLDYTLLHSMIAAATTYLVILIDFGG